MTLTWKDLVTTIFAGGIGGIYYSYITDRTIPLFSNYRAASLILLIVGVFLCAFGSKPDIMPIDKSNPLTVLLAGLGVTGLLLAVWGMITGDKEIVTLLIFDLLALWFLTTTRHAFTK